MNQDGSDDIYKNDRHEESENAVGQCFSRLLNMLVNRRVVIQIIILSKYRCEWNIHTKLDVYLENGTSEELLEFPSPLAIKCDARLISRGYGMGICYKRGARI